MKAEVEWDGYFWVAEAVGDRGVTQAKRLEQVPERLSEVVHLMTGETVAPKDWELVVHYDDFGDDVAADLRKQRAEVEEAERCLAENTKTTAKALRDRGMSLRDIATLVGVTFQRVHQLVH